MHYSNFSIFTPFFLKLSFSFFKKKKLGIDCGAAYHESKYHFQFPIIIVKKLMTMIYPKSKTKLKQ